MKSTIDYEIFAERELARILARKELEEEAKRMARDSSELAHLREKNKQTEERIALLKAGNAVALSDSNNSEDVAEKITQIKGPTFAKLMQAIEAFPVKYPDYKTTPLKLEDDVRDWMAKELGCNSREAHVFGRMIFEHFGID